MIADMPPSDHTSTATAEESPPAIADLQAEDLIPPGLEQTVAGLLPPTVSAAALRSAVVHAARRATDPCRTGDCTGCHLQWVNREPSCPGRRWRMLVKHLLHGLLPRLRRGCSLTQARSILESAAGAGFAGAEKR